MSKTTQQALTKNRMAESLIFDEEAPNPLIGANAKTSAFIPILTILSGPAFGKEIPLLQRQLVLGRGNDCDVVIPDASVSQKHLQFSCRKIMKSGEKPELKVVLRHLGGDNGTLINYVAVRKAVLKPGDKIFIGRVVLQFDHRDAAGQDLFDETFRFATTDGLTSLLNKAAVTRTLREEIVGDWHYNRWISVALIDIDGLKSLNDLYGRLAGDMILKLAANVLKTALRKRDKAGRFGGDEYLIILPQTGPKGAARAAERLRHAIEKSIRAKLNLSVAVTASLGIAACRTNSANPDKLLSNADAALYRAKSLGRNRAEVWE